MEDPSRDILLMYIPIKYWTADMLELEHQIIHILTRLKQEKSKELEDIVDSLEHNLLDLKITLLLNESVYTAARAIWYVDTFLYSH